MENFRVMIVTKKYPHRIVSSWEEEDCLTRIWNNAEYKRIAAERTEKEPLSIDIKWIPAHRMRMAC